jgi:hypothetical protein
MSALLSEDIEMTLAAAGFAWTRRGDTWAVPTAGEVTREIRLTSTDDALHLDAVLIEWDEITEESREALTLFLKMAGRDVAGVDCSLDGTQARLSAMVPVDAKEDRLGGVLRAMSAGCRLLARGARALLSPDLARQYLSFLGAGREVTTV